MADSGPEQKSTKALGGGVPCILSVTKPVRKRTFGSTDDVMAPREYHYLVLWSFKAFAAIGAVKLQWDNSGQAAAKVHRMRHKPVLWIAGREIDGKSAENALRN